MTTIPPGIDEEAPAGARRRVLVVAYYFPPMGLSGVQRVARFVKYLPEYGWQPTVLTVKPGGYYAFDEGLLAELTARGIDVVRTESFDPYRILGTKKVVALPSESSRRRLSLLSQALFVPDNRVGWYAPAVAAGKKLLRTQRFDAVFSSAPPYTAHLVAARLASLGRLPLVTDFRDDWVSNPRHQYPTRWHRRLHEMLERKVVHRSRFVVTINEYIRANLARHGPGPLNTCFALLPQGYDPEDFEEASPPRDARRLELLYCGVFYDVQTPDALLRAVALLAGRRPAIRSFLKLSFVGLVPGASLALARQLGIDDMVHVSGYLPHEESVRRQRAADVLWLTVGRRAGAEGISTSKLFEYFGAGRPILALAPEGAVREALRPHGAAWMADPDDVAAIASNLSEIMDRWQAGCLPLPDPDYLKQFDRRLLAGRLAGFIDQAVVCNATCGGD